VRIRAVFHGDDAVGGAVLADGRRDQDLGGRLVDRGRVDQVAGGFQAVGDVARRGRDDGEVDPVGGELGVE